MVDEMLGGIGEGSKRIEKLLVNLRDFARGDEGALDEMVGLNAVVKSAVMIVRNLIEKSTDSFSVRRSRPCRRCGATTTSSSRWSSTS